MIVQMPQTIANSIVNRLAEENRQKARLYLQDFDLNHQSIHHYSIRAIVCWSINASVGDSLVCTMEKANLNINRLAEERRLERISNLQYFNLNHQSQPSISIINLIFNL